MLKIPSLWQTGKKELLSPTSLLGIIGISFFYLCTSVFLTNYQFVWDTFTGMSPLAYKLRIFSLLLLGLFTAFSPFDAVLMILSALLAGINLTLLIKTLYVIEHQGKVRLSVGGATIISLVTSGCASCGLSILSLLGLSASLSFLPFHGMELHVASVLLLLFSAVYMVKKLRDSLYCKV